MSEGGAVDDAQRPAADEAEVIIEPPEDADACTVMGEPGIEDAEIVADEAPPRLGPEAAAMALIEFDGPSGADRPAPVAPADSFIVRYEARRRRWLLWSGTALIGIGLALFALIVTGVSLVGTALVVAGGVLLVLCFAWRPFYTFYLPGLALTGFGLGWLIDDATGSDMRLSVVGLGVGLMLAWLVRRIQAHWAHYWPLVTGAVLAALGVLAGVDDRWSILWRGWPLLIVLVGVVFVVRALLSGRRGKGGPPAVVD
jgi:hypothetical protein